MVVILIRKEKELRVSVKKIKTMNIIPNENNDYLAMSLVNN